MKGVLRPHDPAQVVNTVLVGEVDALVDFEEVISEVVSEVVKEVVIV